MELIQEINRDIKELIKTTGSISAEVKVLKVSLADHIEDHKIYNATKKEKKISKVGWIIAGISIFLSFLIGCASLLVSMGIIQ
jgi:hypothetical protein